MNKYESFYYKEPKNESESQVNILLDRVIFLEKESERRDRTISNIGKAIYEFLHKDLDETDLKFVLENSLPKDLIEKLQHQYLIKDTYSPEDLLKDEVEEDVE